MFQSVIIEKTIKKKFPNISKTNNGAQRAWYASLPGVVKTPHAPVVKIGT